MAWYPNLPCILAQAAAEAPDNELSVALKLILALAVVVGSFAGGTMIARALRMPDYGFKIGLVLFTLLAAVVVNIAGWPPKRGIDLSGGVVLIYEVDKGLSTPSWMPTAVARINEELNKEGGEKLEARPISSDQIEIGVPEGVDVARVEKTMLELRATTGIVLRNTGKSSGDGKTVLVYRIDPQQEKFVDMKKLITAVGKRINPSGVKELTIRQYGAEQLEVIIPEIEEREVDQIKMRISTSGLLEFRIVANQNDDRDIIKAAQKTPGREVYIGGKLVGRWVKAGPDLRQPDATYRDSPGGGREILVRNDPFDVDGRYLTRASQGYDGPHLAVNFSFNAEGGDKFGQLTSRNLPDTAVSPPFFRCLGIILDNVMLSAPTIRSAIHGDGQITGDSFTPEYVDFLVGVLNAGSLPATLRPEPISQQRISSQLGDDTIRKGTSSIVISTVAILVFMAVYYRFCGLVANLAVVLNIVVTVALMILIKAAFTLPGLAGLVLTVGMAVDANVLIYERMREETERGASLRMAIRNGFSRAMATIIDSHVTTLISGAVLYMVGTDQIKGFAVTLIIGLLMSLFTAVYVARVMFDIAEKKGWLTRLKMMHVIGHTDIDFIRWRGPAIAASVAVIVIGFIATAIRGAGILDIDFTGGSSVQLLFAEGKSHGIAEVRKAVEPLEDVAVSSVGENNREFKVDTSERDIKKVQAFLQETFAGSLQTYSMSFATPSVIEPTPSESSKAAEGAKPQADAKPAAEPASKPADDAKPAPAEGAPKAPESEKPDAPKSGASLPRSPRAIQLASVGSQQALAALMLAQDEPASEDTKPAAGTNVEPPAAESAKQPAADDQPQPPAAETPAGENDGTMVGGTRVELTFQQEISYAPLREMIQKELKAMQLRDVAFELHNPKYQAGSDARYDQWTLETTLKPEPTTALLNNIKELMAGTPVFPSSNQIGGKVAGDTQLMALYALLASMAIIVIYIWIRFQNVIFGLAAVLALVHDVFITTGFLAMSYYLSPYLGFMLVDPFKISLAVMAALLTIVGFSINDTIVVFDRIREVRGKSPDLSEDMINRSVNQTLSRTLLTSGTVLIASVILYFVGGAGIHAFAYSMVVGVIAGTYSSVYIAAPVLLWLKKPPATAAKRNGAVTAGSAAQK